MRSPSDCATPDTLHSFCSHYTCSTKGGVRLCAELGTFTRGTSPQQPRLGGRQVGWQAGKSGRPGATSGRPGAERGSEGAQAKNSSSREVLLPGVRGLLLETVLFLVAWAGGMTLDHSRSLKLQSHDSCTKSVAVILTELIEPTSISHLHLCFSV